MRFHFKHHDKPRGHRNEDGRRFGRGPGFWRGRGEDQDHDRPHRGGGRMGRFFEHGDLRLVVLALIAEKPCHGYEIIKAIEERVGGAYSPSPGVIYPTLTLLEELGYVTVDVGAGGKKLHSITPEGTAFLDANRGMVDALLARITAAGAARASADSPPVLRGMENLKLALRMRLARGRLSEEEIRRIAAALDAAAVAIEQA